jgi:hypothetical protein
MTQPKNLPDAEAPHRWQPQKADVLAALAEDIGHNYGRGRAAIGIAAASTEAGTAFADALAEAVAATGREVYRASILGEDIPPRDESNSDAMLIASGDTVGALAVSGHWNYTVWLDDRNDARRDRDARAAATALIDNTDAEHPRRVFADSC